MTRNRAIEPWIPQPGLRLLGQICTLPVRHRKHCPQCRVCGSPTTRSPILAD